MRFTIKKDEFFKSLTTVARAISNNNDDPILRNIKIELTNECLYLTGSNYSLTIKTFIPFNFNNQEIIRDYKEGSILVNAKHLIDTINRINTEEVSFDIEDSLAIITSSNGKSQKQLTTINGDEYPDIDLEPSGEELVLSKKDFTSLVNQTAFAASTKEKQILTAMNFVANNGVLTVTATDSNRMAVKKINIEQGISFTSNIFAKTMIEISHIIESNDNIHCFFADRKAIFTFDRTIVSTSLVVGSYPDTRSALNRKAYFVLEANSDELINAIESTRIMSIDRENIVDLSMDENVVEFTAKSSQVGSAFEQIETYKYEGEPFKISFNSEFVLSAVKGLGCKDVLLKFEGSMKPFVVADPSDDSVTQVITPVRTHN